MVMMSASGLSRIQYLEIVNEGRELSLFGGRGGGGGPIVMGSWGGRREGAGIGWEEVGVEKEETPSPNEVGRVVRSPSEDSNEKRQGAKGNRAGPGSGGGAHIVIM